MRSLGCTAAEQIFDTEDCNINRYTINTIRASNPDAAAGAV
jgi:hypothetical protein